MKSFLLTLLLSATALTASAQSITELAAKLATGRIELSYDCMVGTDAPVHFSGTLSAQGNSYHLTGNGMEIWCDGATRWSVDSEAREVYIESSNGIEDVLAYKDSISDINLTDVVVTAKPGEGKYSFDVSKLDNSWVITDLRQ